MPTLYESRIKESPIYQSVNTSIESIQDLLDEIVVGDHIERLGILLQIAVFVKSRLEVADPHFVSPETLTNMNNQYTNVTSNINTFKSNKQTSYLDSALSYSNKLLMYISQINLPQNEQDIEGIKDYVIRFKQSIGQHISRIENDYTELKQLKIGITKDLESLESDITNLKGRVDSIITDHQSKFTEEQTTRLQQFADGQKDRDEAFRKNEDGRRQDFENQQFSFAKTFENEQLKWQKDAQGTIGEINALRKKAEEIVTIITNSGLAGAYDQTSKGERLASWIWQGLSVLSIGLVLGFGYFYILEVSDPLTWTQLISRVFLSGVGVTLFGYCAKQAANHRQEQKRNRDIALQFASLDPFIGRFAEHVQEEIKIKLVDRYFGDRNEVQDQQQIPTGLQNNPEFLKAFADLLQQYITKNPSQ